MARLIDIVHPVTANQGNMKERTGEDAALLLCCFWWFKGH